MGTLVGTVLMDAMLADYLVTSRAFQRLPARGVIAARQPLLRPDPHLPVRVRPSRER